MSLLHCHREDFRPTRLEVFSKGAQNVIKLSSYTTLGSAVSAFRISRAEFANETVQ